MKLREAMAAHVAEKRVPRAILPSNGICPASRLPYFDCRCDNHRCGLCGRRWSQRQEVPSTIDLVRRYAVPRVDCPCERNRRQNGFPPHWRTSPVSSG